MKTASVLLLVTALSLGCQKPQEPAAPPAPKVAGETVIFPDNAPQLAYLSVQAAEPSKRAEVGLYGRLAWDDDVTVRIYSPVGGRVSSIQADLGKAVQTGDTLAMLDSPDYGQAQADLSKAAGELALADRVLSRIRELFAHGAAAQKDVEAAEADYHKSVAEQQRALSQLLALSQGNTNAVDSIYRLRTPLSGIVVDKNLTPGQQIRPDLMLANAQQFLNPLFVVTDPHKLWLFLDVTELDAVSLKPGQEIRVHTTAYPERVFIGWLERIGEALDPTTRTIKARVVLDNPEDLLKAEMYVTAEVIIGGETGVDISAKAVFLKNNQYFVFVEEAAGNFVRRAVILGRENGGKITVTSGLNVGQRVVTEGSLLLEDILKNGAG